MGGASAARGLGAWRWWALGAMALAALTVGVDTTVLSAALPTLARSLRASKADLQWFSSGYLLVLAAAMLPAGLLGDRYGRKAVLLVALGLFGVGSAACAYSTSAREFAERPVAGLRGRYRRPGPTRVPVWAAFTIVACLGLGASLAGAVRYGLLNEIAAEGYLLGRSVLNISVGGMQICGFAAGGVLVTTLSPRGTPLVGAALYPAGAAASRSGLTRRSPRAAGRPSVRDTWRINGRPRVWSSAASR